MTSARSLGAGILAMAALQAPPAIAAGRLMHPEALLQRCGAETCLIVRGRRANADAPVTLAGHDVTVQGGRNWRVAVSMETVQAWSKPFARTLAVRIGGADGGESQARLPTGLLGHVTDLAFLDVRATR